MNSNLESFCPKLRKGRVIPQGSRIIFETDNPYNQVVLPMALADLVLLCSGRFSLREIIAKIYKKQGSVPFRSVLKAIHILHQGGFFENGEDLAISSNLQSWIDPKKKRWTVDFRISQRIEADRPFPFAYYAITMAVIIASFFGLQYFPFSALETLRQMSIENGMGQLLIKIVAISSVMMSARHILRVWQQLLLTGKAYNLSLQLNLWGFHLHVGNEASNLIENRLYSLMFYASQILFPWAMILAGSPFLDSSWIEVMTIAALAQTTWDMNPFVNSDGMKLVQSLLLPDSDVVTWHFEKNSLIEALNPVQAQQDLDFARICAFWGGVWLIVCFSVLHFSTLTFGPHVIENLQSLSVNSLYALAAIAIWSLCFYASIHKATDVILSILRPIHAAVWQMLKRYFVRARSDLNPSDIAKQLEVLPLFSHFHEEDIAAIIEQSEVLEFQTGTVIIRNGEMALDLFVLLDGRVTISLPTGNGRERFLTHLNAVSVFGEAALVDAAPRAAQVKARTKALVVRVPVSALKEAAIKAQSVRHLEDFRVAILVNQFFASSPVFRSLTRESIEFLSNRGSLEYFDRNQRVFSQGDTGDYLYLILRGSVKVSVHDHDVKRLYQGGFFGEISMITGIPRTATVNTVSPSIFFKIGADAFWEVLVQHLDLGVFLETVSESRLKEDLEIAKLKPVRDAS